MDNPETLTTLRSQDTGRKQATTKRNEKNKQKYKTKHNTEPDYEVWCLHIISSDMINIDYHMTFFISDPLSALDPTGSAADIRTKGCWGS